MNNFTFGNICRLFCCPPRPSRVVAKFAFLPPPPSYKFTKTRSKSDEIDSAQQRNDEWRISFGGDTGCNDSYIDVMEAFFVDTKLNSRIACLYIPAQTSNPLPYTLLFSHGNAVDLGHMAHFLLLLSNAFGVSIMCYDYSGYGLSTGQPLESNLYADAEAALHELQRRYNCPLKKIILYGQSIGTAPTVDLAAKYKVGGVVLHSALMSGIRVVCPGVTRNYCFDPFSNIDKVGRIQSPTLIIHGEMDEIISVDHGYRLYDRLIHAVEPLWVPEAGHNDVESFPQYSEGMLRFLNHDLKNYWKELDDHEPSDSTEATDGAIDHSMIHLFAFNATSTNSESVNSANSSGAVTLGPAGPHANGCSTTQNDNISKTEASDNVEDSMLQKRVVTMSSPV